MLFLCKLKVKVKVLIKLIVLNITHFNYLAEHTSLLSLTFFGHGTLNVEIFNKRYVQREKDFCIKNCLFFSLRN